MKSLREEIAALMCERYCGIGVMALPEYLPADVEIAEELVNKVLDAAVEAVDRYFYDLPRCLDNTDAIELGSEVITAIRESKGDKK